MQIPHAKMELQQKNLRLPGVEPKRMGFSLPCTSHLDYCSFSVGMQPKFYLMGADMEKYPLINSTLVTVTLSETSGLKERREYVIIIHHSLYLRI
jgi:hypothetical protein